ncbi:MAG TPA: glycoside hydrolase family 172 protein [Myxococcota bacterium]|nr:glycoside hydrolase family 172 protein [Myxococcota bacterium]
MPNVWDPAFVDASLDSRSVTFENPTGARGAGGTAHGGRKGRPNRRVDPGEQVVLADLEGPGTLRHIWMTFPPAPPEIMRALQMDVYYDGAAEPSVSVPWLDFFGLPHGRPATYASALTAAQEGRGFNAYFPMPFARHVKITLTNASARVQTIYYQIDYTLEKRLAPDRGYLHATFARQNPTVQKQDFVIASGLAGPGRFLGCNVGVRVLDPGDWYGEGEVKIFRDGDGALPTICGTGLEDYVGSAWGLGTHAAPYGGAPLVVPVDPKLAGTRRVGDTAFVGFYRWHVPDPVMFAKDLRVTIQQIGAAFFLNGEEAAHESYQRTNPVAGEGWMPSGNGLFHAWGIVERCDDYCATAYVYCREPQAVPRLDMRAALTGIERKPWETANPLEMLSATMQPG